MTNAAPVSFNCPKCPRRMDYVGSTGAPPTITLHYECPVHGRWSVALHTEHWPEPPDGMTPFRMTSA
jgi:hypothetical protein